VRAHHETVFSIRASHLAKSPDGAQATNTGRTVMRNGTTFEQNTAKIGKAKPAATASASSTARFLVVASVLMLLPVAFASRAARRRSSITWSFVSAFLRPR
jgi:hypothetical protein